MISLQKVERTLSHPKSTIYLLILILAFLLLGVLLPQQTINSVDYFSELAASQPFLYSLIDFLSLQTFFKSPIFIGLILLLLLSLILTVIKQLKHQIIVKNCTTEPSKFDHSVLITQKNNSPTFHSFIVDLANRSGYSKIAPPLNSSVPGSTTYLLCKHQIGKFASPILHCGLGLLILASFYGYLMHSRGFVQVMEGETIVGENPGWLEKDIGIFAKEIKPNFSFTLNKLDIEYWQDLKKRRLTSDLSLLLPGQGIESLKLSNGDPKSYQGITFFQTNHFGYVASLIIKQPGLPGIPTHFLFPTHQFLKTPVQAKEEFPLTDYTFELSLVPDNSQLSFLLNNPELSLTIFRDNDIVFMGNMRAGEKVHFDGNDLYCSEITYWSGITMLDGYAMPLIYSSFALIFTGVFLLYFVIPRSLVIQIETIDENQHKVSYSFQGNSSTIFTHNDVAIINRLLQEYFKEK